MCLMATGVPLYSPLSLHLLANCYIVVFFLVHGLIWRIWRCHFTINLTYKHASWELRRWCFLTIHISAMELPFMMLLINWLKKACCIFDLKKVLCFIEITLLLLSPLIFQIYNRKHIWKWCSRLLRRTVIRWFCILMSYL